MKNHGLVAGILGVLAGVGISAPCPASAADTPVVLELFTSQGCSSCPPADALLGRLAADDRRLLPLSFHVDYWDRLGWKDPYSAPANTARQKDYADALNTQVYTPELVVDGMTAMVGSDESAVRAAIARANSTPLPARVTVTAVPEKSVQDVRITGAATGTEHAPATVWAVTYRPHVQTRVENGENGGRTLDHINSVTGLVQIGAWSGGETHYTVAMPADAGDGTAILVQMPHGGRLIGAGTR